MGLSGCRICGKRCDRTDEEQMASPQLKDGFTQIANEILDALARTNLTAYQGRVVTCIIRRTYGFKKKSDRISHRQIAGWTGIAQPHIARTLKELQLRNVITLEPSKQGSTIGIQKDFDRWVMPHGVSPYRGAKVIPNQAKGDTQPGIKTDTQRGINKRKRKIYSKETIGEVMPSQVSPELWKSFKEHRVTLKKKMTPYAEYLMALKLQRFADEGHDPEQLINNAILKGWQDVYPGGNHNGNKENDSVLDRAARIAFGEDFELGSTGDPD